MTGYAVKAASPMIHGLVKKRPGPELLLLVARHGGVSPRAAHWPWRSRLRRYLDQLSSRRFCE